MTQYRFMLLCYLWLLPKSKGLKLNIKITVNVQKCCNPEEIINFYDPKEAGEVDGHGFCMPNKNQSSGWKPKLYDENLNPVPRSEYEHLDIRFRNDTIDWHYDDSDSRCPEMYESFEPFYLLKNGSLYQENMTLTQLYCIDHARIKPGHIETVLLRCTVGMKNDLPEDLTEAPVKNNSGRYGKHIEHKDLMFHAESNETYNQSMVNPCFVVKHGKVVHYIFKFLMVTSIVFLIITFIVYIIVPDLKNLHGKIVLSNVSSIFLVTVYLLVVYIIKFKKGSISCVIFGYIGYFMLISMFGWLTIMCFDLCWTFLRTTAPKKGGEVIKFTMYAVFVYSMAILLTITVFIFDQLHPKESPYSPKVGADSCFIHPDSMGMFVHLPILVIMITNIILYVITTGALYRAKAKTKGARTSRRTNADYGELPNDQNNIMKKYTRIQKDTIEQLVLYTKLFLVMGVLWICETIHYYVHRCHDDSSSVTPTEIFFRIIDAINLLRGFLFFIIFVCKADILKKLRKLPIFIKILGRPRAQTFGSRSNNSTKSTATNRSLTITSCKSIQNASIDKSSKLEKTQTNEANVENISKHKNNEVKEVEDGNENLKQVMKSGPTRRKISFHVPNDMDMKNSKNSFETKSFLKNQSESSCI